MTLVAQIKMAAEDAFQHLFPDVDIPVSSITVNQTKPEFTGDYTVVLFPFLKQLRMKPNELGEQLGKYLVEKTDLFIGFDIVAGFLNLTISDAYLVSFLLNNFNDQHFGEQPKKDCRVMVEYSSPNTNKPLHFGHLRNIFLGYAMSNILKANGKQVVKANLINDRGIHICKSMIAWLKYADGATPESTGTKGDHLVGDYYVKFNDELKKELAPHLKSIFEDGVIPNFISKSDKDKISESLDKTSELKHKLEHFKNKTDFIKASKYGDKAEEYIGLAVEQQMKWKDVIKCFDQEEYEDTLHVDKEKMIEGLKTFLKTFIVLEEKIDDQKSIVIDVLTKYCSLTIEAQEMLRKWEAGDEETVALWEKMNGWVYDGFKISYKRLGVDFDKMYYESNTYLLGKNVVEKGLNSGVLFKKEDGSVWVDLQDVGLDEKLLLRGDGTSVYMTQDLGTAKLKYKDYNLDESIYVIGDEQNYHMQVLKEILKKLEEPCADGIYHLSYGMVELPSGKMKSREGTVVDADDMMDEMIELSGKQTEEAGKTEDFSKEELSKLYETIGMGALKFYLLRVDPKKKMIFDPKESIDLHGFTATFVQYAHARICSILRKEGLPLLPLNTRFQTFKQTEVMTTAEKKLILLLEQYPVLLQTSADEYNPSLLCNYAFQLAQSFNSFYAEHSISKAENEEKKQLRLMIIVLTAQVLRHSMNLLGIRLPEKM